MDLFLQQLLNGLALGSIYALFGIGFGLMLATLGVLNAAHGTFATGGAIGMLYLVNSLGLNFWLSLVLGVVLAGVLAVVVDRLAFEPIRRRSTDMLPALITSIGVWILLLAVIRILTGARSAQYDPVVTPSGSFRVGPLVITYGQTMSLVSVLVVGTLLFLLVQRTRMGAAMRAVGFSSQAASLSGVNPARVTLATAFLAGAVAGLAGILTGVNSSNVGFMLGEGLLLKGFAAVIIGGFGDVRGTVLAGLFIGVAEVLTGQYATGSLRDAFTFGLLLFFLIVRPKGIFGSAQVVERARA